MIKSPKRSEGLLAMLHSPRKASSAGDWDYESPLPLRQKLGSEAFSAPATPVPNKLHPIPLLDIDDDDDDDHDHHDHSGDDVETCSNRNDDGTKIMEATQQVSHQPIRHRRCHVGEKNGDVTTTQKHSSINGNGSPKTSRRPSVKKESRELSSNSLVNRFHTTLQAPLLRSMNGKWGTTWCSKISLRIKPIMLCLVSAVVTVLLMRTSYITIERRRLLQKVTLFDTTVQRTPLWQKPPTQTNWVVFYNAYISPDPILSVLGRYVVEEQLGQIASSYAAASPQDTVSIYITSIGQAIEAAWLQRICTSSGPYNLTCIPVAHYEKADEVASLTRLHEYCADHTDQSVIYLHNKGSLHPGDTEQDRWRRTMTAAVTSQQCLDPAASTEQQSELDQCNACGMLFQTLPMNHFPGNMWTAKCSYIKELLSPTEYHTRHGVVDEWVNTQLQLGIFTQNGGLFPIERQYVGRERYETEHWLGSHPDLRPCDVSSTPYKDYWLEGDRDYRSEFHVALAPRHGMDANWVWYRDISNNATLSDEFQRTRDFFLLRGVLYRFLVFYGKIPDWHSWIWDWFPDGGLWKDSVNGQDPWTAINTVAHLPGTTKANFLPQDEEVGVSKMEDNIEKFQY